MLEPSEQDDKKQRDELRKKILGLGSRSIHKSYYPELRRRLEELQSSEERYRAIFNFSNDAIFIHDPRTGTIIEVNDRAATMFGIPREEILRMDVVMPEMNGRDLAKRLLVLYPGLKRLFMSGYTANVIAHHGILEEGVHFIQKPFSKQELADKVREALDE